MKRFHFTTILLAGCFFLTLSSFVLACLWDSDTLKQERSRFPSALELITGKFLRHSPEFYRWRIEDRKTRIAAGESKPELYDDLAVAYEKTGQHALAIETIVAKEKLFPGLYETYSNLGTFHILAGDFELGLPYIDKALAINANAHFGREKYQKWLVEYALSRKRDGKIAFPLNQNSAELRSPLDEPGSEPKYKDYRKDFPNYLARQQGSQSLPEPQYREAIHAVLGMMRFANHDNPLLLEVLGDLLLMRDTSAPYRDAKLLAARAYLQASYVVTDPKAKKDYVDLARDALTMQVGAAGAGPEVLLPKLEADLKHELSEGSEWYAQLREQELAWIKEGKNADAEFDKLYELYEVATEIDPPPAAPMAAAPPTLESAAVAEPEPKVAAAEVVPSRPMPDANAPVSVSPTTQPHEAHWPLRELGIAVAIVVTISAIGVVIYRWST